ncbi:hypothetical protein IAU60_001045 [Kwoniella sp. DSM 27419]
MADPFAASPHIPGSKEAARYSNPSFSPTYGSYTSTGDSNMPPARTQAHQAAYRASTGPGQVLITDEFGTYSPGHSGPSHSTSAAAGKQRQSMPMPLPMAEPIASTSHAYASSHSHTAQPQQQARAANRRSHDPTTTLVQQSPPKAEYLTDEYVLHPSVYAYKEAHPRRPMIGFGPYVLLQTLGEGEFGKVKLGVHTDYGVEVAIKLIRRGSLDDEARASKVEREIDVLKTLKHPNIVRMFDVIDTEKYIGIVLEYAGGGELFEYILANRYLKDRDAQKLFAQLISGVDYLHKKHIVHRDLKLENLLLDKHRNIIITDFGFANRFDHAQDDLMATSCGSPCYAAPELVVSEGLYVGSAVDIWSCGVILYAMLSGYLPYDDDPLNPDGDNINLLYKYIMNTKLNFPEHVSPLAQSLLQMMLVPLPEHRCTINQIMSHPWLAGYRDVFARSVEEHEYVFQDAMYRKSQQAKRELSDRKRAQAEAREARASLQRSQSSMPGTTVTASMLDYQRSREQRHQSALPTTSTMPEYLNNAGHRTPPLDSRMHVPPSTAQIEVVPETPLVVSPPAMPAALVPMPPTVPTPTGSPRKKVQTLTPALTPTESIAVASIAAVENESTITPLITPPLERETQSRPPMSANTNRHTIQVEYDSEATWDTVQQAMQAKGKDIDPAEQGVSTEVVAPVMVGMRQGGSTDIEMESGSSDTDHGEEAETVESIQESPAAEVVPAVVETPVPRTPSKKDGARLETPASPTTPRASAVLAQDANNATPRAERVLPITPKASKADRERRAHMSMPPPSLPSARAGTSIVAPTVPQPKAQEARSDHLPKPVKRDRARKGMSLDKFGLAKLLGQTSNNDENRAAPPSAGGQAAAVQAAQSKRSSVVGVSGADVDKKGKRKTLQLMVNRVNSREEKTGSLTPLTPRDMNPPQQVRSKVTSPPVTVRPGESSPSVVTVDAYVAPPPAQPQQKTASSKAAKKVMDWFRRKSLAKDTLTELKSAGVRSDSQSSFVRVSPNVARPAPKVSESTANLAMSSVSSITHTQEGPVLVISEPAAKTEDEAQPESATLPRASESSADTAARTPLGPAASKANIQSTSDLLSARDRVPTPERSKSHRVSPSQSNMPSVTSVAQPDKSLANRPRATVEDMKMRIHTGLVDQSALSSKPPKEVMAEVVKVLQEMGMDIKRENEFRLRCTRVRRRKAGPTTGLGLGSVMSVGSGMGSFSLMSSASSSKTDSRGLPMPMSPSTGILSSGGLKGMLLRRGSSFSGQLPRSDSEVFGSPSLGSASPLASGDVKPANEPLYGEHSVDNGDEVKFMIELCRIKNLPGLYLLTIKRLRGSVWSFKFIYQTVVERTSSLTH